MISLKEQLKAAESEVLRIRKLIRAFDLSAEANTFEGESLESVEEIMYDRLRDLATADCSERDCWGDGIYIAHVLIDGKLYKAVLDVEYGRYDKQYYFVDSASIELKPIEGEHE